MKHGGALILRMPITDIAARGTIKARYAFVKDGFYICPAQLPGNRGWFAAMQSPSVLRILSWHEAS